jgi:PKD repeat protein
MIFKLFFHQFMRKALYFLLALPLWLGAKNLEISNVQLTNVDAVNKSAIVQFNIGWEHSWRAPNLNWDAAWVFIKLKQPNGNWVHAHLSDSGHFCPTTGVIETGFLNPCLPYDSVTNPVLGAFLYRSQIGTDTFGLTGVSFKFYFGNIPAAQITLSNFRIQGIEMVYIPQDTFYVGSGGTEINAFYVTPNALLPFKISNEAPIDVNQGFGTLNYPSGGDRMGPIPAAFPKGFDAFYMMKYHITQQEYVDFLNTLTIVQQSSRVQASVFAPAGTYMFNNNRHKIKILQPSNNGIPAVFETEFPYVPAVHLNWQDLGAYLDWSGLRPFTELEFEKAGRGPVFPVPNEFAWGTAAIRSTPNSSNGYQFVNLGLKNEAVVVIGATQTGVGTPGEAIYQGTVISGYSPFPISGPGRVGIFEKEGTREEQGKSYYGVSEMSGQLYDRAVTVGSPSGRLFTGTHGNGAISTNGLQNVPSWPTDAGMGFRGGDYWNSNIYQRLSDRHSASANFPNRATGNGGRGARSAPTYLIGGFTSFMYHIDSVSMSFEFNASASIGASSFQWSFGDGATGTGEVVNHTYTTNDTMVVRLIVSNACYSDTLYDTIIVSGLIQPCPNILQVDFSHAANASVVNFTDASTVLGTATYSWTFGDGNASTLQNPSHTYANSGIYTVCLTVNDSCYTDSICKQVAVCGNPPLAFSWTSMGPSLLQFSSNWPNTASFLWDFGNGSISTQSNPVQFLVPGNYNVCLTVSDSICGTATLCETLTPCNMDPLRFSATQTQPRTLRFTPSNMQANSYLWDLGDGRTSIVQTPLITYQQEGTYYVCLTAQDSCGTRTTCDSVVASNTIGLADFRAMGFNVYPNPAQHQLVIDNPNQQLFSYTLYNGLGQVVLGSNQSNQKLVVIAAADLPRGLYYLLLELDGVYTTQKIVLE